MSHFSCPNERSSYDSFDFSGDASISMKSYYTHFIFHITENLFIVGGVAEAGDVYLCEIRLRVEVALCN